MNVRRSSVRLAAALMALVLGVMVAPVAVAVGPDDAASTTTPGPRSKLRSGLRDLVAGRVAPDPRLETLISGYRDGEIAYFAVLSEPNDRAHRAALEALGARVLRRYRSADAFALASRPRVALEVARLSWVRWMTPVDVVVALDHEVEANQQKSTPGDLSAQPLWNAGATGEGITIAVIDTGIEPTHQDLDDLDFRHWSEVPSVPDKIVASVDFNGGECKPGTPDAHGHGTHVAGIAAGTGEGDPTSSADDGQHAGLAPDARLAIAKGLTDAGAGVNSDLVAAMEWAAMPEGTMVGPACPAVGAQVVNLSLGSESRPQRLNSGEDVDFVSFMLDRLAARYGTLFVAAAGNSGPYIGSTLEAPGSASQALSVAATAKDWDLNHDDTASGDSCAGYVRPGGDPAGDNTCDDEGPEAGWQRRSLSSFSSRGSPDGGLSFKPDVSAPGYNIVSAQSKPGAAFHANDFSANTRTDPYYATGTGTSMAAPATAGSAALILDGYRDRHGRFPSGPSGVPGAPARSYALVRAALMNTALPNLHEGRWILTVPEGTFFTSLTIQEVRNRAADPFVGPLGEGAGKINPGAALAALRDGVVIYRGARGPASARHPSRMDFQGAWRAAILTPGVRRAATFVLRAAPASPRVTARFEVVPGNPSDGSRAIPTSGSLAWRFELPSSVSLAPGDPGIVEFALTAPRGTPAGVYTGAVVVSVSNGQRLRVPIIATVPLHDSDPAVGSTTRAGARIALSDVFAKGVTLWPSLAGAAQGAAADWNVFTVRLDADTTRATFSVYDSTVEANDTYDLYLYDHDMNLVSAGCTGAPGGGGACSTHPFSAPGVTDQTANEDRAASTPQQPQRLTINSPSGSDYLLAVNRAVPRPAPQAIEGNFGGFVLEIDEVE